MGRGWGAEMVEGSRNSTYSSYSHKVRGVGNLKDYPYYVKEWCK